MNNNIKHVLGFIVSDSQVNEVPLGFLINDMMLGILQEEERSFEDSEIFLSNLFDYDLLQPSFSCAVSG
ncbi:hypothetical protein Avbf_16528 [Armadillidium vulgare]|nr:hypothetical protein Avbf_16528 [Armadillidium vulgare]